MKIAIVGAGLTGLAAAKHLLEAGHQVELFERGERPGGLAMAFPFEDTQLERYYHHIFLSDHEVRALVDELGLVDRLMWLDSKMGFFTGDRLYEFGTPKSLLGFKPLGWLGRLRFGLSILALQRIRDWRSLERVTATAWLRANAGERAYRTVWEPLLKAKFGRRHTEIGMAWLWGKITLRASTREKGQPREQLGYMRGSFGLLGERLVERVEALGGHVRTGAEVADIRPDGHGVSLRIGGETQRYDRVLLTVPMPTVPQLVSELPEPYAERAKAIDHTGVICMVLTLRRAFSDFYWLNIGDARMPFGGLIEHTNLVHDPDYNGRHVLYVSNYLFTDEPLYHAAEADVLEAYMPHLQRINPAFEASWIESVRLFRAPHAQPVILTGYGDRRLPYETPHAGVYVANMTHIYPEDRGMNYALRTGYDVASAMLASAGAGVEPASEAVW